MLYKIILALTQSGVSVQFNSNIYTETITIKLIDEHSVIERAEWAEVTDEHSEKEICMCIKMLTHKLGVKWPI